MRIFLSSVPASVSCSTPRFILFRARVWYQLGLPFMIRPPTQVELITKAWWLKCHESNIREINATIKVRLYTPHDDIVMAGEDSRVDVEVIHRPFDV